MVMVMGQGGVFQGYRIAFFAMQVTVHDGFKLRDGVNMKKSLKPPPQRFFPGGDLFSVLIMYPFHIHLWVELKT